MLVGNKTPVPEQAFFKQIFFDLIEGVYEKKDLPYLKVGREVRIREEDLKEFLENSLTPCVKVRSLK